MGKIQKVPARSTPVLLNDREQVWEMAINCIDHDRKAKVQGGDIIVCRKPRGEIGRKEAHTFLWLRVKGLTDKTASIITESILDDDRLKEKRRYCVPFSKLGKEIDEIKARNPSYYYQPQIGEDAARHRFKEQAKPIDVRGCIYDKLRARYLNE